MNYSGMFFFDYIKEHRAGEKYTRKDGTEGWGSDFARIDPVDGQRVGFYFVGRGKDRPQVGCKYGDTRLYAGNPRAVSWIHGEYGVPVSEIPCLFKQDKQEQAAAPSVAQAVNA